MGKGDGKVREEKRSLLSLVSMIQGADECVRQAETLLVWESISNGGRDGCLSETKVLLIFAGCKNDPLRCG